MFRKREEFNPGVNEVKRADVGNVDKEWSRNQARQMTARTRRREMEFSEITTQLGNLNNMTDSLLSAAILEIESTRLTEEQEEDCVNRIINGNFGADLLEATRIDDFVRVSRNSRKSKILKNLKLPLFKLINKTHKNVLLGVILTERIIHLVANKFPDLDPISRADLLTRFENVRRNVSGQNYYKQAFILIEGKLKLRPPM